MTCPQCELDREDAVWLTPFMAEKLRSFVEKEPPNIKGIVGDICANHLSPRRAGGDVCVRAFGAIGVGYPAGCFWVEPRWQTHQ